MNSQLKELNFNKLLVLDTDIESYDFDKYEKAGGHKIKGFCTLCENNNCHTCPTDPSYTLQNISHGATSDDFILASGQQDLDFSQWKQDGIIFLMEGPSIDFGFYEENTCNGFSKKPSRDWYWVHNKQKAFNYPEEFKGGKYGSLFNSIIFTFKLKNAYLTNLVKCGLNNDKNNFKGINEYDWNAVQHCFENFLRKEIEIIKPKVVFCFGSNVYGKLNYLYQDNAPFLIFGLPHPAGQRRGFKDEYYRHLYYSIITEGLYKAGIFTLKEASGKYEEFLSKNH